VTHTTTFKTFLKVPKPIRKGTIGTVKPVKRKVEASFGGFLFSSSHLLDRLSSKGGGFFIRNYVKLVILKSKGED